VPPAFELVKVEGDAVFAAAPASAVDGQRPMVLGDLGKAYRAFVDLREQLAVNVKDDN
jgi:hypothetical protein